MIYEQEIAQQCRDEGVDQREDGEASGEGPCVEFDESCEAPQGEPTVCDRQLRIWSPEGGVRTA